MLAGDTILVDTEMQRISAKTTRNLYHLAKRDKVYHSRLTVEQKNDVSGFQGNHYENVLPTVTIWIMPNQVESDLVYQYSEVKGGKTIGEVDADIRELTRTFYIYAGKDWEASAHEAVKFAGMLFRPERQTEDRLDYLSRKGVQLTMTTRDVVQQTSDSVQMYFLSDQVEYDKMLRKHKEEIARLRKMYEEEKASNVYMAQTIAERNAEIAKRDAEIAELHSAIEAKMKDLK